MEKRSTVGGELVAFMPKRYGVSRLSMGGVNIVVLKENLH